MGYSREFVGTVYCTYRQSNTTNLHQCQVRRAVLSASWSQLLTELHYHGPSSCSRFPEGIRLPQTNTLDMVQGLSSPSRKVLLPWSPVELELALRAWLLPAVREPFAPGTRRPLTSLWPRVLRPVMRIHLLLGVEVTADAHPAGASSLENWSVANRSDGLPGGWIIQVKIRRRLLTQLQQMTELTQLTGAHQWTGCTVFLKPVVWQTKIGPSRHGAGGLHGNAHHRWYGSQSTQLIVSVLIMTGSHNPSSMTMPSTGMDVQYRLSNLAAPMGTSNMQQQVQDVYWIQPPQFGPLDQQILLPRPQFELQSTTTAGALSQQAQDALTMG